MNHRPNTKGYLKEHVERGKPMFLVGAEDTSDKANIYQGPVARITWDDTWLNIVTDDYEGHAMLNIETLPHLIRALKKIARKVGEAQPDGTVRLVNVGWYKTYRGAMNALSMERQS